MTYARINLKTISVNLGPIQEAQLPQKKRAFDIAVSYGATKHFSEDRTVPS